MKLGHWALFSFHVNDLGVDKLGELSLIEDSKKRRSTLTALKHTVAAEEAFYLSTCNRVEFLFYSSAPLRLEEFPWLSYRHRSYFKLPDVIQHLLRVAVGRDSVVTGENQILGQFKKALSEAQEAELTGPVLNPTLQIIIRETKALRTKVRVSNFPSSISTVAGKLVVDELSSVSAPILLVGYSETHQILARFLRKWKYNNIIWTNRTDSKLDKDNELIDQVIPWEEFQRGELPKLSVISVATRSERYVLSEEALKTSQPEIVLDLSVPANADKTLVERFESRYVGISEISEKLSKRKREVQAQLEIIDDYIEMKTQAVLGELTIKFNKSIFTQIVEETEMIFQAAFSVGKEAHLSQLDHEMIKTVEDWSRKLVKKVSHKHLETLKSIVPHTEQK